MTKRPEASPFTPFFQAQGVVVLDGGLATTLESYGKDLNDPLWSARALLEDPAVVRRAHLDFLQAGADCIATATYQATHDGLMARGLSRSEADEVFRRSVDLAVEARDDFWEEPGNRDGRLRPLVAGSIGPYGAYLADGSEYTGDYGLTARELRDFHTARFRILAESELDLLAFETIPSGVETQALADLLADSDVWAWMSFQCRDSAHLADGSPLDEVVASVAGTTGLAALGVNCIPPSLADPIIRALGAGGCPVAVYPNSGERYDPVTKTWGTGEDAAGLDAAARDWADAGAQVLGGCCRVLPAEIQALRGALLAGSA